MICDKCKSMMCLQAFSKGNCKSCGNKIITEHIPCRVYCLPCAMHLGVCEQCGKELEGECK